LTSLLVVSRSKRCTSLENTSSMDTRLKYLSLHQGLPFFQPNITQDQRLMLAYSMTTSTSTTCIYPSRKMKRAKPITANWVSSIRPLGTACRHGISRCSKKHSAIQPTRKPRGATLTHDQISRNSRVSS
ncbi:unnamed protein product, partial [Aphanomyces euteiches]